MKGSAIATIESIFSKFIAKKAPLKIEISAKTRAVVTKAVLAKEYKVDNFLLK